MGQRGGRKIVKALFLDVGREKKNIFEQKYFIESEKVKL